ncbi:uncharacterized protein LOC135392787 [Ornithodoros turicata]|uniref:uncharacterized protein LOC135392787 n=1 Tax=Ornithodoros turicata TaxID=34597 RepID=UPI003139EA9D
MASLPALISFLLTFNAVIFVSAANYGLLEVLQSRKEREVYRPLAQNSGTAEVTIMDLPHQVDFALEKRRLRRNQSQSIMLQVNVYNAGSKGQWEKHRIVLPLVPYTDRKREEHARYEEATVLFHENDKGSLTHSEENQTTVTPKLSFASPIGDEASSAILMPRITAKKSGTRQPSSKENIECATKVSSTSPTSNNTPYTPPTPQRAATLKFRESNDGYKNATWKTLHATSPTMELNGAQKGTPRKSTTPGTPKSTCLQILLDHISTTHTKTKQTKLSGCVCGDASNQQLKHEHKISGGTLSPFPPKEKLQGCSNGPCQLKSLQPFAKNTQGTPKRQYKFDPSKKHRPTLSRLDSYRKAKPVQETKDYYDDFTGNKLGYQTLPRRTWKNLANDLDYAGSGVDSRGREAPAGRSSQNAWKKFARKTLNVLTEDVNDVNRWDRLGVR